MSANENYEGGNTAAMRAALLKVKERIVNATTRQDWSTDDAHFVCDTIEAALAAPLLNCDVGTADEQLERWKRFCVDHHEPWKHGVIATSACNCPCFRHNDCNNFVWAQMPYEESEVGK